MSDETPPKAIGRLTEAEVKLFIGDLSITAYELRRTLESAEIDVRAATLANEAFAKENARLQAELISEKEKVANADAWIEGKMPSTKIEERIANAARAERARCNQIIVDAWTSLSIGPHFQRDALLAGLNNDGPFEVLIDPRPKKSQPQAEPPAVARFYKRPSDGTTACGDCKWPMGRHLPIAGSPNLACPKPNPACRRCSVRKDVHHLIENPGAHQFEPMTEYATGTVWTPPASDSLGFDWHCLACLNPQHSHDTQHKCPKTKLPLV